MKMCGVGWEASQVTGRGAWRSCGWMCPSYHCLSVERRLSEIQNHLLLHCYSLKHTELLSCMKWTTLINTLSDQISEQFDLIPPEIPTAYSALCQKLTMHFHYKITFLQYFDLKFCVFLPLTVTPHWATNKMLLLKLKERVWDVSGSQTEGTQCAGPPSCSLMDPGLSLCLMASISGSNVVSLAHKLK